MRFGIENYWTVEVWQVKANGGNTIELSLSMPATAQNPNTTWLMTFKSPTFVSEILKELTEKGFFFLSKNDLLEKIALDNNGNAIIDVNKNNPNKNNQK